MKTQAEYAELVRAAAPGAERRAVLGEMFDAAQWCQASEEDRAAVRALPADVIEGLLDADAEWRRSNLARMTAVGLYATVPQLDEAAGPTPHTSVGRLASIYARWGAKWCVFPVEESPDCVWRICVDCRNFYHRGYVDNPDPSWVQADAEKGMAGVTLSEDGGGCDFNIYLCGACGNRLAGDRYTVTVTYDKELPNGEVQGEV